VGGLTGEGERGGRVLRRCEASVGYGGELGVIEAGERAG
jgi:hypothetical protein